MSVFRVRQVKNNSCSLLLQHSCRTGWSDSKFSSLCTVHYPNALNEAWFTEGINVEVVAVCLLHTKLIWHQRYSQLWHCVVWQIGTNISEYLLSPSSGWWRQQVPLTMLLIYQLTVAGPTWQATSPPWEPHISFYMTFSKFLKSRPKSDWYEIVNSDI